MKVLMLARYFPTTHCMAGEPTFFQQSYRLGRKIHTIRRNAKGYFRDGDEVSIRQWEGRPYRSKQEEEIATNRIHLEPIEMIAKAGKIESCKVNDVDISNLDISRNDGLSEMKFFHWFFPKGHGTFKGDILHFTGFRYLAA